MKPTDFIKSIYDGDDLIHSTYGKVTIRLGPLINGSCVFVIDSTGEVIDGSLNDLVSTSCNGYHFVSKNDLLSQEQVDLIIDFMDSNNIYDVNLMDHFGLRLDESIKKLKKR